MEEMFSMPHLTVIFSSGWFILLTVMICVVIALENRNPTKTISWLLVLTLLPVVGVALYLLFGENLRKRRWNRTRSAILDFWETPEIKQAWEKEEAEHLTHAMHMDADYFDLADRPIMKMVLNSGTAPIVVDNQVDIFTEGCAKFEQLLADMEAAEDHIHLE